MNRENKKLQKIFDAFLEEWQYDKREYKGCDGCTEEYIFENVKLIIKKIIGLSARDIDVYVSKLYYIAFSFSIKGIRISVDMSFDTMEGSVHIYTRPNHTHFIAVSIEDLFSKITEVFNKIQPNKNENK